ncbi:hypothetical protein BJX61DRAFT_212933 [Aspergillus egyptiacus]|nr:hypothetical protein BJX61DRAFT_212933 [Aspergillus egyptiacus]
MAATSLLLALPTELLVEVFQSAPDFHTAAKLAAASKQLYAIWREHLPSIYSRIAQHSIPCHVSLRQLLADLGKLPLNAHALGPHDIALVVRIAEIGDDIVEGYTEMINDAVSFDPQVTMDLSTTEKHRLIRAHYKILGLLSMDQEKQRERIQAMNLKNLFLLSDVLCVFIEEAIEESSLGYILEELSFSPAYLQHALRAQRNKVFMELYGRPYRPIRDTPYENGGRYAWWCDSQQATFKKLLTGRVFDEGQEAEKLKKKVRDDLWYDSSEED